RLADEAQQGLELMEEARCETHGVLTVWSGVLFCLQDPFRHGHRDPEGHSVTGEMARGRSGALKALVRSVVHYRDPSGMTSGVLMGICVVYTVQTRDKHMIRSADLGHQES
ncbi:hypothetical protein ACLOJK_034399, partial [Asimina triloba]